MHGNARRFAVAAAVVVVAVVFVIAIVLAVGGSAHAAPSEFEALRARGWLWAYLGVFAAGFLTSLTPCVYPMIPIVLGIFGARDESATRGRAFLLATMYVAGMGLMFSGLGVGVALAGRAFGTVLANPWVVIPLVTVYAALASSMFGAFEFNLPPSLQAKLSSVGGRGVGGAFAMGVVGGLTAAPCTGPILLGILAFVATTHDVPLGFSLLLTYAIGMGVLFWALALFALSLPKSGRWMESVKAVGGIALLVMGAYFLRPIAPAMVRLTHRSPLFFVGAMGVAAAGIGLGGVHLSFHDRTAVRVRKLAGIALAVVGAVGALNWTLTPRTSLPWRHDEAAALAEARAAHAPVLIDFGAEWCVPCKVYEAKIFADPVVHDAIAARWIAVKVDLTSGDDAAMAAQERWGAKTLPTVILLDGEGHERRRFGEPIPTPDQLVAALAEIR